MMTKEYQKLIQLIKEEKNIKEICDELNIDSLKLSKKLKHLENLGYSFVRQFDTSGNVNYRFNINLNNRNNFLYGDNRLKVDKEGSFRFVAISDLHIGNSAQRLDYLDNIFNYCAKEDVHVIMSCGDLIDGTYSKSPQEIVDPNKQIKFFIENYPKDKDIVTYGVGGDHEYSILEKYSIDPIKIISKERQDIMIPNYRDTYIDVNASLVRLNHNISKLKSNTAKEPDINLIGHYHEYITRMENNKAFIFVPTLTEMTEYIPGAIDLSVTYDEHGRVDTIDSSELMVEPKVKKLGVNRFKINHE